MDIASCEERCDGMVDLFDVPYYAFSYIGRSTCSATMKQRHNVGIEVEVM